MISSVATLHHDPGGAPYSMGKAAMEALAFTLSKEVKKQGIRVNVVAPGLVETEMGRRLMKATAGIDDLRKLDAAMPFGRRVTNALASAAVSRIVGARVPDPQSGFRAVRRIVLERVRAAGDRYEYETEFLIAAGVAGFRIAAVPIATTYGAPSHFRAFRDSARVVRAIWRQRAAGAR